MRFLTPTQNKRLNELVGFLCISLAVLIALALLSYFPRDASFNVSAEPSDGAVTNNWMGPVGAHASDLLFQVFSQRYETGSTIVTTNEVYKKWAKIFNNDATLTSAVLDRLLHHAETIPIEGKSYRMKDQIEDP